jgi:hypothetical protein
MILTKNYAITVSDSLQHFLLELDSPNGHRVNRVIPYEEITPEEFYSFISKPERPLIQVAFPRASAGTREFIMTGMDEEEWNELTGGLDLDMDDETIEDEEDNPPYCGECKEHCEPKIVDFGIGSYEFWGQKCHDQQKALVSDCCETEMFDNKLCTRPYYPADQF